MDITDLELAVEDKCLEYIAALINFADEDYDYDENENEIWYGESLKSNLVDLCNEYHFEIRYPEWGDGCIVGHDSEWWLLKRFYIKDTVKFIDDISKLDYFEIYNGFEDIFKARDVIENYYKGE